MEMEYKNEGGFIIMKAGGKMPDELLKTIRAINVLVEKEKK